MRHLQDDESFITSMLGPLSAATAYITYLKEAESAVSGHYRCQPGPCCASNILREHA